MALYESKQGGVSDAAAQVSSTQRDCVGFNLILAIVLFNVTKSHDLRNRIMKNSDSSSQLGEEVDENDSDEQ